MLLCDVDANNNRVSYMYGSYLAALLKMQELCKRVNLDRIFRFLFGSSLSRFVWRSRSWRHQVLFHFRKLMKKPMEAIRLIVSDHMS